MRRLTLGVVVLASLASTAAGGGGSSWWRHVVALASDDMGGRDTGSDGERRAAECNVAARFRDLDLRPTPASRYIQPVPISARRVVEASSLVALVRGTMERALVLGEDVIVTPGVDPAAHIDAPLVFVGYGLRIPAIGYDDLDADDVRGAIVVRIAGAPADVPAPLRTHAQSTAEFARALLDAGAIGVVTIAPPASWRQLAAMRQQEGMDLAEAPLSPTSGLQIALSMNAASADAWFVGSGYTLQELTTLAQAGRRLPRFPLLPTLRARIAVERRVMNGSNVIGVLEGSDSRLRHEYVVVSAHLDHLGTGDPVGGDRVFNGAIDNAAGVATLIEVATTLSRTRARPRRSVVFLATTGEEKGMLGSRFFVARSPVPPAAIVAAINCDMFFPIHPLRMLTAFGMNESTLGEAVRRVAADSRLGTQDDPEPQRNTFARSDQYSFVRAGVPSLMLSIGAERGSPEETLEHDWLSTRYHTPSDDVQQPIDLQAADEFNRIVASLLQAIGNEPARPRWNGESFFRRFDAGTQ